MPGEPAVAPTMTIPITPTCKQKQRNRVSGYGDFGTSILIFSRVFIAASGISRTMLLVITSLFITFLENEQRWVAGRTMMYARARTHISRSVVLSPGHGRRHLPVGLEYFEPGDDVDRRRRRVDYIMHYCSSSSRQDASPILHRV